MTSTILWHSGGLLQDICASDEDSGGSDVLGQLPGLELMASWYAQKDGQGHILREALVTAVIDLVDDYKRSLKFRELKLFDLLFYGQLAHKKIAKILGLTENQVAVSKHRYLARLCGLSFKQIGPPILPGEFTGLAAKQ